MIRKIITSFIAHWKFNDGWKNKTPKFSALLDFTLISWFPFLSIQLLLIIIGEDYVQILKDYSVLINVVYILIWTVVYLKHSIRIGADSIKNDEENKKRYKISLLIGYGSLVFLVLIPSLALAFNQVINESRLPPKSKKVNEKTIEKVFDKLKESNH